MNHHHQEWARACRDIISRCVAPDMYANAMDMLRAAEDAAWNRRAAPTEPAVDRDAVADALRWLVRECDLDGLRERAGFDCWLANADKALAAPAAPAVPSDPLNAETLNALLWFYRRAKPNYGTLLFAESAITALRAKLGQRGDADSVAPPADWLPMPPFADEAMMHAAQDVPAPRPYGAVYRAMFNAVQDAPPSPSVDQAKRLVGGEVAAPVNDIPATIRHDEGAIARCFYCSRYSLDPATLSDRAPLCDCGKPHGWSGSFKKPGADAKWSGKAPDRASTGSATSTDTKESA